MLLIPVVAILFSHYVLAFKVIEGEEAKQFQSRTITSGEVKDVVFSLNKVQKATGHQYEGFIIFYDSDNEACRVMGGGRVILWMGLGPPP